MIEYGKKYLMFIEPKAKKMEDDVNDELTIFTEMLGKTMKPNNDVTKGWHRCSCNARSDFCTFTVSLAGVNVQTNSLLLHYVKNHRSEVPEEELEKLKKGLIYFNNKKLKP